MIKTNTSVSYSFLEAARILPTTKPNIKDVLARKTNKMLEF